MTIAIWPARLNKCTEATARSPLWFPCYISSMSEWENLWMIVLKQGSSEACKLVWSFHLCPYSSTNSLLLSGGLLPRKKWKWSVVWGGFKKSCTSGKGTIHGLRLQDFQDSETLRLWDSGTLFVYLASIFVLTLLLPGHVLEGNEIHISDFFVGMNYSISLLDLYLSASLRVQQLYGIPVLIIGLTSPRRSLRCWTTTTR